MFSPWLRFLKSDRRQRAACRQGRRTDYRLILEGLEVRCVLSTTNLGAVDGIVFVDNNANGVFDAGEGVNNARVELYQDTNNNGIFEQGTDPLTATQNTAADGSYSFTSLTSGSYFVVQPSQIAGSTPLDQQVSSRITIDGSGEQGQIIDTFTTVTGPTLDEFPAGTPVEENFAAAEAIGGERDFLVELTSGQDGDTVRLRAGAGVLRVNPDFNATGRYITTWDGPDTPGLGVDHDGLGGVDLTLLGGVSGRATGICLHDVQFDQPGGIIQFRVYTDANNFSEATISNIPAFQASDYFIPFSGSSNGIQFSPMAGNGADFTNVGAVRLEIISTVQAMDGRVSLLNAIGPAVETVNFRNDAPQPAIDIEKFTNGVQADTAGGADVPIITPGNTVTWTYEVTNTGQAQIVNVRVTDDRLGTVTQIINRTGGNDDNLLDPGETWVYQATGTAVEGSYENKATVVGLTAVAQQVMDMDLSHYVGAAPSIDIEKFTNGNQADNSSDADVPTIPVGDTVTWTYRVTNTGTIDLVNVQVSDDRIGSISTIVSQSQNNDNILQPGEVWEYQATGNAQAGSYANKATVTGAAQAGQQVMDMDTSHYVGAVSSIDIEKFTNGNQADISTDADVPTVFVGQQVTFTYEVRNTGNVPLTNVQISDDNGTPTSAADDFFATFTGGDTDRDTALDVAEVWEFSSTRTATAGLHTNVATVTARDPAGTQVSDSDPSNHVGVEIPPLFGKRRFLASSFP